MALSESSEEEEEETCDESVNLIDLSQEPPSPLLLTEVGRDPAQLVSSIWPTEASLVQTMLAAQQLPELGPHLVTTLTNVDGDHLRHHLTLSLSQYQWQSLSECLTNN